MRNVKPYIIGIDPGAKGGVACLRMEPGTSPTLLFCDDLPYLDGRLDAFALNETLNGWGNVSLAVVEKPVAMPSTDGKRTMGAQSMLNYGMSYGMILGVLISRGIPVEEVHPSTWKKPVGLVTRGMATREAKEAARALAKSSFPLLADRFKRVKDDGRAEAALIGLYGARRWQRGDVAA